MPLTAPASSRRTATATADLGSVEGGRRENGNRQYAVRGEHRRVCDDVSRPVTGRTTDAAKGHGRISGLRWTSVVQDAPRSRGTGVPPSPNQGQQGSCAPTRSAPCPPLPMLSQASVDVAVSLLIRPLPPDRSPCRSASTSDAMRASRHAGQSRRRKSVPRGASRLRPTTCSCLLPFPPRDALPACRPPLQRSACLTHP